VRVSTGRKKKPISNWSKARGKPAGGTLPNKRKNVSDETNVFRENGRWGKKPVPLAKLRLAAHETWTERRGTQGNHWSKKISPTAGEGGVVSEANHARAHPTSGKLLDH